MAKGSKKNSDFETITKHDPKNREVTLSKSGNLYTVSKPQLNEPFKATFKTEKAALEVFETLCESTQN